MDFRRMTAFICAGGFLLAAAALHAAPNNAQHPDIATTAEIYGTPPEVQMVAVSPSGDAFAYRHLDDERDLVVVRSMADGQVIRLTDVSDVKPQALYFVSDTHLILQISDNLRLTGFRGIHDVSIAYSLNIKTGDINQLLTPGYRIYMGQTDIGRIVGVSPDGKYVYMPAYMGEGAMGLNPHYSLVRVNIERPRSVAAHARGHSDSIDFLVDRSGAPVADVRYSNTRNRYSILVPDGRSWRTIFELDTPIPVDNARAVTPDGKSLVYVTEQLDTGRFGYALMSLEDGTYRDLPTRRQEADISHIVTDINRVAYGVAYAGFTPEYQIFDDAVNKRIQDVQAQFPDHAVHLVGWTRDWSTMLFYVSGLTTPGEYLVASENQPLRFLVSSHPKIPEQRVHPVVEFSYAAADDLTIPALLTVPLAHAEAPRQLPLVVLPHGGPHAHDEKGFDWMAQALAEHGYLVVQPQFRGSTGFGVTLYRGGFGEWGGKMQGDLKDAVTTLVDGGLADRNRVCIMGGSYGGYAALAGAAFDPDLYRCAISINGVSDINRMMRDDRRRFGRRHWLLNYFERSIAADEYSRERINRISPINAVESIKIPILLIHGEDDDVVPESQSSRMYRALRRADKPVTYIKLPGEGHHLLRKENRVETLTQILTFLETNLAREVNAE